MVRSKRSSRVRPRKALRRTRTYKRRNTKINKRAMISNAPLRSVNFGAGLPMKATITHKYVERITLNNSLPSAIQNHYFSCNGMYDPNVTGGGHQPLFFDQLSDLYDQYCVIMSKIVVTFQNMGTTSAVHAGIFINDDTSTTGVTYDAVAEQTGAKLTVLSTVGNSDSQKTLTYVWGIRKAFGKNGLSNSILQGSPASNPTEQQYFNIFTQPVDNTTATTVYCTVKIYYTAVWYELKDVAQS